MKHSILYLAALIALGALIPSVDGAEKTWEGDTSSDWSTGSNWTGGAPGSSDIAVFYSTVVAPTYLNLSQTGDRSIGGIRFSDSADSDVSIDIGPGAQFRLLGNIVVEAGSEGSHQMTGNLLRLGAANEVAGTYNYSIANNSAKLFTLAVATFDSSGSGGDKTRNLTFEGSGDILVSSRMTFTSASPVITGNLIKSGTGTVTFASANGNSYNGSTTIQAGTLLVTNTTNSATSGGNVTVKNSGTLGGTGRIAPSSGLVQVESGGALLAGNGIDASGSLTIVGNLTLNSGSKIKMVLGPGGAHSTLARSSGTWSFASGQAFEFTLVDGATATTYDNLITGITVDPGVGSWTILSPGITGAFVWDGANIDLVVSAIPEPSVGLLFGLGLTVVMVLRHRRMTVRG